MKYQKKPNLNVSDSLSWKNLNLIVINKYRHWSVAFTLCMTEKEKVAHNIVVLMPWVHDIIICQ